MADRVWQFHWSDGTPPMELPEEALVGFDPGYSGVSHATLADGSDLFIPWTQLRYVAAVPNLNGEEVTNENDADEADRESETDQDGQAPAPPGTADSEDRAATAGRQAG